MILNFSPLMPPLVERKEIVPGFFAERKTMELYDGFTVNCVEIGFGGPIKILIDEYGHLHLGNLHVGMPWLTGTEGQGANLSNAQGWALRIGGDICAGDIGYFGATSTDGTEVQQIGVRSAGAYPSATVVGAGEPGFDKDNTGSGFIVLHPDVDQAANGNGAHRGNVLIAAHGSGAQGNEILLGTRTGNQNTTWHWKLASDGGLVAMGATGGSMGPGTINAKGYFIDGVAV